LNDGACLNGGAFLGRRGVFNGRFTQWFVVRGWVSSWGSASSSALVVAVTSLGLDVVVPSQSFSCRLWFLGCWRLWYFVLLSSFRLVLVRLPFRLRLADGSSGSSSLLVGSVFFGVRRFCVVDVLGCLCPEGRRSQFLSSGRIVGLGSGQ
jgi:hypothetical protein